MERWPHKQVAKDLCGNKNTITTLEIGAGNLNQLQYEPEVGPYDIVEPFKELYKSSGLLRRIRFIYHDINEVPYEKKYNRITSVATFEHICNLPEVIAKAGLILKSDGVLRVSIPSEGTFLWKLGWKLTTGIEFKIYYGLDYGFLMAHEHVNTSKEIEEIIKYFFNEVRDSVFGINKCLSFYQFYECKSPNLDKCIKFIR